MRVAREIRNGSPERVSPFAHAKLGVYSPLSITLNHAPYYLRFRVKDRPGILASITVALARHGINVDAVLQESGFPKDHLPFVVTVEPCEAAALAAAMREIEAEDFHAEPVLVLPVLARGAAMRFLLTRLVDWLDVPPGALVRPV